jgi:hypothetical protein
VFALISSEAGAAAQARDAVAVPLPRAFVGAAIAPATNDADSRMRLVEDGRSFLWLVEAGAALSGRIGIGAELAQASAVTGSTSGRSFNESGRQEERTLIGLIRTRAAGTDRVALDVVGGAGVLFQHHELRSAPCFSGCADTRREALDRQAPAFALGADVPFRVGRHVAVTVLTRYYALRREERISRVPNLVPWQYESRPSSRMSIGISARAVW